MMRYQSYVPFPVREHLNHILPICDSLLDQQRGVPTIVPTFNLKHYAGDTRAKRSDFNPLDEHSATLIEEWTNLREIAEHKRTLLRFAEDPRMQEAYSALLLEFTEDTEWQRFIWAAATSNRNFDWYHADLNDAADLCDEMRRTCEYLAYLGQRLRELPVNVPAFNSIGGAIYDDGEIGDPPQAWFIFLHEYLESLAGRAEQTAQAVRQRKQDRSNALEWNIEPFNIDSPTQSIILAAIKSRQRNRKTDYLRAFAHALMPNRPDGFTPTLATAMAITATVVLNDMDLIITTADVRLVIGGRRQTGPHI